MYYGRIIWPLSICIYIRGLVHEFVHEWGPARGRGHGQLASLPAGRTPGWGDNLHISLLSYRIYTEWPYYYAFRDHNNLAIKCICKKNIVNTGFSTIHGFRHPLGVLEYIPVDKEGLNAVLRPNSVWFSTFLVLMAWYFLQIHDLTWLLYAICSHLFFTQTSFLKYCREKISDLSQ